MTPASPPFSCTVLVVDDDPISRDMLILMLRTAGVSAAGAEDGQEATEVILARGASRFEVVFTDVQMPRMNGFALLDWINQHSPATATVVMTANQEREMVSASLRGGAVEFIDKPFDLRAVIRAAQQARETHLKRIRQSEADRRLRDIADINQRLTGNALGNSARHGEGLSLATRFYAMDEAGGDLVKAAVLAEGRVLLVLGDVSGHGLKEGFLSAYFQGIIAGMVHHAATCRSIAEAFNRFLIEQWNDPSPLAVTTSLSACFIELDLRRRTVSILNCGSPGVLLVDGHGAFSVLAAGGSPLGWFPTIEPVEITVPIDLHGQLWLWSDGLEAHADLLQIAPLALASRILREPAHALAGTLLRNADDDIVACRLDWVTPPPASPPPTTRLPFFHAIYPGDAAPRIDPLQADWLRALQLGLPALGEAPLHDIPLCVREAVLNALDHGCGHDAAKTVRLELRLDAPGSHLLALITDDGPGFDPTAAPANATEHISLGLQLIRSLAQSVQHSANGRTIEMTFSLSSS